MKIQRSNQQRGSILAITIVIMGLVTLLIAALLTVVKRQNYLTARSATWCSEIPIAEAGIEEALTHYNSRPMKLTNNGWKLVGSNYVKSRYFTNSSKVADGYFYAAISKDRPPVIVSVGYGRIPLQTNYTQRTVMVFTRENVPIYGIRAAGVITMGGSSTIDSYDSSDPTQSTDGKYDITKRSDQAAVGTLSTATPAIKGGHIYGYAATGPGGTVTGTVGDGAWQNATTGLQDGHVRDDFSAAIPEVPNPTSAFWNPSFSSPVGSGDYKIAKLSGAKYVINGKVRLWVTGDIKLTGSDEIKIAGGGSLELYIGGKAEFGGGGIVNKAGTALECMIYGLKTCTDIDFRGNAAVAACIYAPNADIDFGGTPDLFGSITGKTIDLSGTSGIHYDEALGVASGPPLTVIAWEEL